GRRNEEEYLPVRRSAGAGAWHEYWAYHTVLHRTLVEQIEQHLYGHTPKLYLGLLDRRQWWGYILRHRDVVETDHAQILRNSDALLVAGHQHTDRDHVVITKDGRDPSIQQRDRQGLPGDD